MWNHELELRLYSEFKWLKLDDFEDGYPVLNICFCENGRYELIRSMLKEIEELYSENNKPLESLYVLELREDRGLHILFMDEIPEASDIAIKYEELSMTVCASCGKPGREVRKKGTRYIRCADCG